LAFFSVLVLANSARDGKRVQGNKTVLRLGAVWASGKKLDAN
jgi:hypothetical protein